MSVASPSPRAGIARKSPCGRRVDVDLRRHHPVAGGVALERGPGALDRLGRRDRGEHRLGSKTGTSAIARQVRFGGDERTQRQAQATAAADRAALDRRRVGAEAAAIVAAIEQFLADTAPAPAAGPAQSPWQRAALEEGIAARQLSGVGLGARAAIEHRHRPRTGPATSEEEETWP